MVIISNGFNRYPLSRVAAEMSKRNLLARFITAGYPTPMLRTLVERSHLDRWSGKAARLLDRSEKELPADLVASLWFSETVHPFQALVRRLGWPRKWIEDGLISEHACRIYGFQAARCVAQTPAQVFHYRSGFGHYSVQIAKRKGMVTVCDHSIPHPGVLAHLIESHGKMPPRGCKGPINRFWESILNDLQRADSILVASEFVKETFVHQGWDPARLHVAYFGIDDKFFDRIPEQSSRVNDDTRPVRFLYSGEWGLRKAVDVIAEAFRRITDLKWELVVTGGVDPTIDPAVISFLHHPNVHYLGMLPTRSEVVTQMTEADVFVFPSLAEGSARVTSEAMACGLYMITTANACDLVRDGINGALVPPGNADALERAIRFAIARRPMLSEIGRRNAQLIRTRYRQSDYGDQLTALYEKLLREKQPDQAI
jgi:glycosyltransferase involved in cell wall biosynthesis